MARQTKHGFGFGSGSQRISSVCLFSVSVDLHPNLSGRVVERLRPETSSPLAMCRPMGSASEAQVRCTSKGSVGFGERSWLQLRPPGLKSDAVSTPPSPDLPPTWTL